MTERIDHASKAREALAGSGDGRNVATDASVNAVAHALLALAEQQRIANLVALGVVGGGPINNHYPGHVVDYLRGEFPEVAAALGITEETDDE